MSIITAEFGAVVGVRTDVEPDGGVVAIIHFGPHAPMKLRMSPDQADELAKGLKEAAHAGRAILYPEGPK